METFGEVVTFVELVGAFAANLPDQRLQPDVRRGAIKTLHTRRKCIMARWDAHPACLSETYTAPSRHALATGFFAPLRNHDPSIH
jgi:hypothetical protein